MSDEIQKSLLNKSLSKQRFTFSKIKRFKEINKSNSVDFYNLPEIFSKKIGKTFMKSKREVKSLNLTAKSEYYNIPREFDKKLTSPAYTFGISRKFYNKVYVEKSKIYEKNNPGPGTYNYLKDFGSGAPKYTKYIKTTSSSRKQNEEKNLGPGEYVINKIDINKEGKYTLSKFKNTISFNFGIIEKTISKKSSPSPMPGPGEYQIPSFFDGKGFNYISKHKSSIGKTFGMKFKDLFVEKRNNSKEYIKLELGPGQYKIFSEFGYPRQNTVNTSSKDTVKN